MTRFSLTDMFTLFGLGVAAGLLAAWVVAL